MPYGVGVRKKGSDPRVPVDIQDAVEKWARKHGRHGRVVLIDHFDPPLPQVRLTPVPGDPRKKAVQEGRMPAHKAEETVELHYPDEESGQYVPYRLSELGASGVIRFLDKGNTWSGRGQFDSLEEAVEKTQRDAKEAMQERKADLKEDVKHAASGVTRRRVMGHPAVRAGADLLDESPDVEPQDKESNP